MKDKIYLMSCLTFLASLYPILKDALSKLHKLFIALPRGNVVEFRKMDGGFWRLRIDLIGEGTVSAISIENGLISKDMHFVPSFVPCKTLDFVEENKKQILLDPHSFKSIGAHSTCGYVLVKPFSNIELIKLKLYMNKKYPFPFTNVKLNFPH